ncbi:MAG: 3'(2'),5'-bisphosphate nucleotidase CysQ [Candidatus Rokubacteria bacterium]|nr:3'(2'),5'-bisphosphate nucleotidase CysQ [Candidatus Rokubacteria bacterium]
MLVDDDRAVTCSMAALDRLVAIARAAGTKALAYHGGDPAATTKADGSPVTEADAAAHAHIVVELTAWNPDIPIVSEEGAIPDHATRAAWPRFWLVDPLDGTKEFIKGYGEFTVNIALVEGGEPVLGVVYAPALDCVYFAGRGLGAFKADRDAAPQRLTSRPARPSDPVVVVESRSHPSPALEDFVAGLNVARREQLGSSLKICRLAEGTADVYARFGPTMEWDVAAADCVFRNSGATAPRVSPLRYNQCELRNGGFVLGFDDLRACPPNVRPAVIWLTGLSGAGKSTIAERLAIALRAGGHRVEHLDGDVIRHHGVFVLVSLISPYRTSRGFARELARTFVEVHVATPLDECERRDVKGLYARARRGEIRNFTGLDDPYEPPEHPEVCIDTRALDVDGAVARILAHLGGRR